MRKIDQCWRGAKEAMALTVPGAVVHIDCQAHGQYPILYKQLKETWELVFWEKVGDAMFFKIKRGNDMRGPFNATEHSFHVQAWHAIYGSKDYELSANGKKYKKIGEPEGKGSSASVTNYWGGKYRLAELLGLNQGVTTKRTAAAESSAKAAKIARIDSQAAVAALDLNDLTTGHDMGSSMHALAREFGLDKVSAPPSPSAASSSPSAASSLPSATSSSSVSAASSALPSTSFADMEFPWPDSVLDDLGLGGDDLGVGDDNIDFARLAAECAGSSS